MRLNFITNINTSDKIKNTEFQVPYGLSLFELYRV